MERWRAVQAAAAAKSDEVAARWDRRHRVDLAAARRAEAAELQGVAHPVRAAGPAAVLVVVAPAAAVMKVAGVAPLAAVAEAVVPDVAVAEVVAAAPHAVVAEAALHAAVAEGMAAAPDAAVPAAGAAVPDALVVAPVPAAVGAAVSDALVVAAVPAVAAGAGPDAAAGAVALDAVVAVAGSAAAAAFSLSPFPDLLEALGRSRARHRMAWRVLIRAPQPTRSCRPTATFLFWTSANDLSRDSNSCRTKVSQLGHSKFGVSSSRIGQ
jgi:hypothetical protein